MAAFIFIVLNGDPKRTLCLWAGANGVSWLIE
jgi:hypothetical protein